MPGVKPGHAEFLQIDRNGQGNGWTCLRGEDQFAMAKEMG